MPADAAALARYEAAAARAVELVGGLDDPDRAIRGSDWTCGQVVGHLISAARNHAAMARGGGDRMASIGDSVVKNLELLSTVERVDAGALELALADLEVALREHPMGEAWPFHAIAEITADDEAGLFTGELLLHGADVAAALGRPWRIDPGDAAFVMRAALSVAPACVSPQAANVDVVYEVRLRGDGAFTVTFEHGTCTVTDGRSTRADCRISADPVAFLLVSYGRRSPTRAALTGSIVAFGRKPWLAFRFGSLLRAP